MSTVTPTMRAIVVDDKNPFDHLRTHRVPIWGTVPEQT